MWTVTAISRSCSATGTNTRSSVHIWKGGKLTHENGDDLQYKTTNNKKLKTLINTYRGFRLANKLPSHGQNTHSNGKTAKK